MVGLSLWEQGVGGGWEQWFLVISARFGHFLSPFCSHPALNQ